MEEDYLKKRGGGKHRLCLISKTKKNRRGVIMLKRIHLLVVLFVLIIFTACSTKNNVEQVVNNNPSLTEQEELVKIKEYTSTELNKLFNSVEINKSTSKSIYTNLTNEKKAAIRKWKIENTIKKGDILITYSDNSDNSAFWVGGHAGLYIGNNIVIEAYGNKASSLNGVKYWSLDRWKNYESALIVRVYSASDTTINKVISTAKAQINKPYNHSYFNCLTTSKFYCSQLVWYSWLKNGYDFKNSLLNCIPPIDFYTSGKTFLVYTSSISNNDIENYYKYYSNQ